MKKQFLRLLLLHYLSQAPAYGYGLKKRIKTDSKGLLSISDATLYRVLFEFEREGWITRQSQVYRGKERVYYSLNEFGLAEYMVERIDYTELKTQIDAILGVAHFS